MRYLYFAVIILLIVVSSNANDLDTKNNNTPKDIEPTLLLNFEAKQISDYISLNWATDTEIGSREFVLERAIEGQKFEPICNLKGRGNSTNITTYFATDIIPVNGQNTYQVKQINHDGSIHYYESITIDFYYALSGI